MELDVKIDKNSISIPIKNPFQLNINEIVEKINGFATENCTNIDGLDIKGLIPRMVKGIAGCESGCPANAKELAEKGFKNFKLTYIEGGILVAEANAKDGKTLIFRMFPDF